MKHLIMKKKILYYSVIALFIDQVTKFLSDRFLPTSSSVKIIDRFFYLTNCHNSGAAFSILKSQRTILILAGFMALYIMYTFIKDFL